jgi:2-polyprenyl-6-methoxyphenol hydroxylase-like FAD-dependent oxidoreductase
LCWSQSVRNHIFEAKAPLQAIPQGVIVAETSINKSQLDRQLSIAHSAYVALGDGFFSFAGLKSIADDAQSATYYWFVIWNDEDAARDPENYWTTKASKQQLYDFAVEKSKGLESRLTEIIRLTDAEDVVKPPLVIRDLVLKDLGGMPNSRITLLGDAAHPMTPCEFWESSGLCNTRWRRC